MKVPAKMDYAVRALLELGLHWPAEDPVHLNDIGRNTGVPPKFLVHILIALKSLGMVESTRGRMGGYILAREPREINLAGVVRHLGGWETLEEEKRPKKNDAVSFLWQQIDRGIEGALKGITLEDLCNRRRQQVKALSYDI